MTTHEEIFAEIRDAMDVRIKLRVRYSRLYSLLNKICIERSENFQSEFSGLFSRLYAVCQESQVDYHSADRFRRNALLVLHGKKAGVRKISVMMLPTYAILFHRFTIVRGRKICL